MTNSASKLPMDSLKTHSSSKFYARVLLGVFSVVLSVLLVLSIVYSLKFGLLSRSFVKESSAGMPPSAVAPYVSTITLIPSIDGENTDDWELGFYQPSLLSFVSEGEANYIEGDIGLSGRSLKIFVNGRLGNDSQPSVFYVSKENNLTGLKTFDELKGLIKSGQRFRISYLTKYPSESSRTFDSCRVMDGLCTFANIADYISSQDGLDVVAAVAIYEEVLDD